MATRKISELNAITEAAADDVLVIVDVSEETTNKITKSNFLIETGHSIEVELNPNTYELSITLKNAAGTVLNTETVNLPSENALTNITYSNGNLTLIKQSGETSTVDISGLLDDLKEIIGVDTNTYNPQDTYNIGDIVSKNEKTYKCKQDNVTGPFDISKWDEKSVVDIFNGKVDKVQGKGLSEEDFTSELKEKLEGDYTKPNGGIPKSDLSSDVQASLNKADSALQEHQDISGKEDKSNKVTEFDENSTDDEYPSAKAVYDSQEEQDTLIEGLQEDVEELQAENADLNERLIDAENNQLTGTAQGTEIDLTDSADSRVRSIKLEGNSKQETTEGKNKFNGTSNVSVKIPGISTNYTISTNSLHITGKGTWGNLALLFQFTKNTNYALSFKEIDTITHNAGISVYGTNVLDYSNSDLTTIVSNIQEITANQKKEIVATFNSGNYDYILFRFWNNGSGTSLSDNTDLQITEIQLEEGTTVTPYEPFTGRNPITKPIIPTTNFKCRG